MCVCVWVCDGAHRTLISNSYISTPISSICVSTAVHTIRMRKLEIKLIFTHSAIASKTQSYAAYVCWQGEVRWGWVCAVGWGWKEGPAAAGWYAFVCDCVYQSWNSSALRRSVWQLYAEWRVGLRAIRQRGNWLEWQSVRNDCLMWYTTQHANNWYDWASHCGPLLCHTRVQFMIFIFKTSGIDVEPNTWLKEAHPPLTHISQYKESPYIYIYVTTNQSRWRQFHIYRSVSWDVVNQFQKGDININGILNRNGFESQHTHTAKTCEK